MAKNITKQMERSVRGTFINLATCGPDAGDGLTTRCPAAGTPRDKLVEASTPNSDSGCPLHFVAGAAGLCLRLTPGPLASGSTLDSPGASLKPG
jgi:hypothetical protein